MNRFLNYLLVGAAGAATGVAASLVRKRGPTAAERERRRRLDVNARGRTGNATIIDVADGVITYTYEARGMEHTASQDVSALTAVLPADPATLTGRPAILKYLASNPANSIVVCEEWSGLLFQPQATGPET
jgi:hypothetical protein